jgi:hypothetical protein
VTGGYLKFDVAVRLNKWIALKGAGFAQFTANSNPDLLFIIYIETNKFQ